ncbi:hypothetical protein RRG08_043889 [Elysia crispata]|uniref:Uncharacterized protein n=1 Tax=Elysia crispata TaxID=231223 RepID=A0AAE1E608_9GAST|nr:hypothetical protein RRG08_043889 [Elysia crispata]
MGLVSVGSNTAYFFDVSHLLDRTIILVNQLDQVFFDGLRTIIRILGRCGDTRHFMGLSPEETWSHLCNTLNKTKSKNVTEMRPGHRDPLKKSETLLVTRMPVGAAVAVTRLIYDLQLVQALQGTRR